MNKCIDCKKQKRCAERRGSHKYCFVPKNQTNYDRIKNMSIEEMAKFLKSILDNENNHNVGCYDCIYYGTHHSDRNYKNGDIYECNGCPNEFIGFDLVKWLESEVDNNDR